MIVIHPDYEIVHRIKKTAKVSTTNKQVTPTQMIGLLWLRCLQTGTSTITELDEKIDLTLKRD